MKAMTKRERAIRSVKGEPVDRIPTGFWLHFPREAHHGQTAIDTHLDFFKQTETDICKVMNENLMPCRQEIFSASDLRTLRPISIHDRFITDQIDIVRRIADRVASDAVVLATIHGTVVSTHHSLGKGAPYVDSRQEFRQFLLQDKDALIEGFKRISEGLCLLSRACIEAGADGIYYAALGAEKDLFTDEEYAELVEPFERMILRAAENPPAFNVLHICKSDLSISRFADYPVEVVNWAIHERNPSLLEGAELFRDKAVLGGLDDRAGALVDGTREEIDRAVFALIDQMKGRRFLLGADCTLPEEISYERIRMAVTACARHARQTR